MPPLASHFNSRSTNSRVDTACAPTCDVLSLAFEYAYTGELEMRRSSVLISVISVVACAGMFTACTVSSRWPSGSGELSAAANQRHFRTTAMQVADQWNNSAAPAAWRDKLILLSDSVIRPVEACVDWFYRVLAHVSVAPESAPVQFADGTSMPVRVTPAAAAVKLIAADPHGQTVQITRAMLGSARFLTNRGLATLPAWRFSVDDVSAPIIVAAVAPSALTERPFIPHPLAVPIGLDAPGEQWPLDDDSVTVRADGACSRMGLLVLETDQAIVVAISRPASAVTERTGTCGPSQFSGHIQLTAPLSAPIGGRPVLDISGYLVIAADPFMRSLNT